MARKRSRYPGLYKPDNSPYWQYRFMVNGKRLSVSTGETAVEAAWQKAQALRSEAKSAAKDRYAAHRKRSLSEHFGDWAESLRSNGRNIRYVNQTVGRATRVLSGCKLRTWDDLFDGQASPASRVQRFLSKLRDRDADANGKVRIGKYECKARSGVRTRNYHLQAVKQFCAWMIEDRRAPENPLDHLRPEGKVKADIRHGRRRIEKAEMHWLQSTVENTAKPRFGISGPDRVRLYRMAVTTGLRANEIRSVTWARLDLSADNPTVTVEAAYSKNGEPRAVPLPDDTAAMLRNWRAERANEPADTPVFRMPSKSNVARMLRKDLEAARSAWIDEARTEAEQTVRRESDFLAYVDHAGLYADFHALRHTAASELVASGVPLKVAADILGHKTLAMTMEVYSHTLLPERASAMRQAFPSRKPVTQSQAG